MTAEKAADGMAALKAAVIRLDECVASLEKLDEEVCELMTYPHSNTQEKSKSLLTRIRECHKRATDMREEFNTIIAKWEGKR